MPTELLMQLGWDIWSRTLKPEANSTCNIEINDCMHVSLQIVPGLPKTRSGKIMRRILRKIAAGRHDELGDVSTLADPSVVERIIHKHVQKT